MIENRLLWMDYAYGSANRRKILAGAVGAVKLSALSSSEANALALAQYVRVGQSTRFGQGAFRVHELGADPYVCDRAVSLLDRAITDARLDDAAQRYDLPAGVIRRAARTLKSGSYHPKPPFRIAIPQPTGQQRTLAIPTRLDRALQRVVADAITPSIDLLLDDASIAYRRGLGRTTAARRVRQAVREGYRFGLRADFIQFFDSIRHDMLRDRLEAYLADAALVNLIMTWVRSGSPMQERGIPTGAPLSPVLANLFLDQFDEEIARHGGLLVRYADDFLIVYRTKDEAQHVFATATQAAQSLALSLNEAKTQHVSLGGFEFLGYQFEKADKWRAIALSEPKPIEEINWRESPRKRPDNPCIASLPGESQDVSPDDLSWVVLGPGASQISADGPHLICNYGDGNETRIALDRVHELLVLGRPTIAGPAIRRLLSQNARILLADDRARSIAALSPIDSTESPDGIAGQVDLMRNEQWRLGLARVLIHAKIINYAALADAVEPVSGLAGHGSALRAHALRAVNAESLDVLRGIEGVAAARWYSVFRACLPEWFQFKRRVAPDADDPANVMLNLAMTALHRQAVLAVRLAGLAPTIGFFHATRSGHAALASDLQEPFRHLMDRAVLQSALALKPKDFVREAGADPPLRIAPNALRQTLGAIHAVFAQPCQSAFSADCCTYRRHLLLAARALRRHVVDRNKRFEVFRHPGPDVEQESQP